MIMPAPVNPAITIRVQKNLTILLLDEEVYARPWMVDRSRNDLTSSMVGSKWENTYCQCVCTASCSNPPVKSMVVVWNNGALNQKKYGEKSTFMIK